MSEAPETQIKYVPPVKVEGYFTATFDRTTAVELIVALRAHRAEFEIAEATENFLTNLEAAYEGDLPNEGQPAGGVATEG